MDALQPDILHGFEIQNQESHETSIQFQLFLATCSAVLDLILCATFYHFDRHGAYVVEVYKNYGLEMKWLNMSPGGLEQFPCVSTHLV